MKPVIERLLSGGGMRYVTLHNSGSFDPIDDLSSSIPGEYGVVSRIFLPIKKIMSRHFFRIKNQKKVDLSEVSQTHFLRQTIDFLSDIVKQRIVRCFYQKILLLAVILSYLDPESDQNCRSCAGLNKSRTATPPPLC